MKIRTRRKRLGFEALEPRRLLDAESLVISEFMAVNDSVLADGLGEFEDWIEIYNPTDGQIDLDGWYLTDKDDNLTKWPFPAHPLDPGEFLVVFASGQEVDDFVDPAGNLHTNFKLDGDGENVALVMPNGNTVAHAYWNYPAQVDDVSYGLSGLDTVYDALVDSGAALSYHVPTPGDDPLAWTVNGFDDSSWTDTVDLEGSSLEITEIATGARRFVEIQNVSDQAVDMTNYRVLVNDAAAGINAVHSLAWSLSGSAFAGWVDYRSDDPAEPGGRYWGDAINWGAEGPGWAMIVDAGGSVMDFVAWGYSASQIAGLEIDYGPFADIRVGDRWSGPGAEVGTDDPGPVSDGFVAFNDHIAGAGTHANATTYAANGADSGPLKNIDTGADTGVTLRTSHAGVAFQTNGAAPATGTDAYGIFDGYVDFRSASRSSLEVAGGDHYTHTFSDLDAGDLITYNFAGTAIRGNSGYDDRWTLVTLEGAVSATPAHSSGIGVVPIGASEAALWTGHNSGAGQGFVVAWTDVDPGPDGEFSVVSTHYTGATPGVGGGTATGSKGYGLAGVRLGEVPPSGPLSWLRRIGDHDGDTAADFARLRESSEGVQNPELILPFATSIAATTGVGFSDNQPSFEDNIATDVHGAMYGVNASLWSRIEFPADIPSQHDHLTLRIKYDDGFLAYLNGQPLASRNAPETPAYDSVATGAHPDSQAVVFEEIDISDYLPLLQDGANVLAVHGLNLTAGDDDFLILPELIATISLGAPHYMITPTPRAENVAGALGYVKDTEFSVDRGFYDAPQSVAITSDTSGAVIMYTTDGSKPTESHGTEYTGPITVDKTTTLRAMAYKPGYEPTDVDTHTYVFVGDVVRQDYQATLDAGFPTTWNGTSVDYGMDPDVIGTFDENGNPLGGDRYGGVYAATIRDDLKHLPTLSIVMNIDDMFGSNGIYSHPTSRGLAWEREASAELIFADGVTEGFQEDCGIRIQGGHFRGSGYKKHSLRLLFKEIYGDSKLRYAWFGEEADTTFDTITLRAGANDGYVWSSAKYTEQYTRDQFGRDLQRATGNVASNGDFVHLYINGIYWGLYNPAERPDDNFSASYFGGENEDWDSRKVGETVAGDAVMWNAMLSKAAEAGSSLAAYRELQGLDPVDGTSNPAYPHLLDVPAYIDYLIVNLWGGNWDWPWKNWWAGRDRTTASTGWKFYTWDFENTLGNNLGRSPLGKNALNNNFSGSNNAGDAHTSLKTNPEYALEFADHVHRHLFNGGVLTPESLIPRYAELAAKVEQAMVAESARWGDHNHNTPLTQYDWYDADQSHAGRDWILNYYLPQRTAVVLGQFQAAGLYPAIVAPAFQVGGLHQHGGQVAPGQQLTTSAPAGTIYYTLDGTDPRQVGGAVNPGAIPIASGAPIPLTNSALVKTRVYSGGRWSALNEAVFLKNVPAAAGNLVATEINYHPFDPTSEELAIDAGFTAGDFEFIEFKNIGGQKIDVYGAGIAGGIDFDADAVLSLDAGEYLIVASNPDAFAVRYDTSGIVVAGKYQGSLNDAGEKLTLTDRFGQTLWSFDFNDSGEWPGRADGKGATLVLIDPNAVPQTEPERTEYLEDGASWRSSVAYGGAPGADPVADLGIVVNEVLTHTDPQQLEVDTIELHNTTGSDVDLAGWYLSDSWGSESNPNNGNYRKYRIPDDRPQGTVIPAHGYLLFDERDFNPTPSNPDPNDFALDSAYGDDVWLMKADASGKLTHFGDHVEFGAADYDQSWGLWPDAAGTMYPMISPTLGSANNGPRLGSVIISEVHYHPDAVANAGDLEFLEIYNRTPATVDLTHWRVRKGIDFDFPAGATLGPYSTIVLVPFDLDEIDKLTDLTTAYGITWPVEMYGGYSGRLSNAGEKVQLQRPGTPRPEDPTYYPGLLEDEVFYDDKVPWPMEADGGGDSLNRSKSELWGNDAANWDAATPTPGKVPFTLPATIVDRHVFYNNSRWDGFDPGPGVSDDAAIATDKSPLLPGDPAATFANYTSYSRGIGGVMIDVRNLADGGHVGPGDFEFRVGNDYNSPAGWATVPNPLHVNVRRVGAVDRITLIWPDDNPWTAGVEPGAISKQWLQVRMLSTENTGLLQDDVFYFGNAIGETGDTAIDATVNSMDEIAVRNNPAFFPPAAIDNPLDFDRDKIVGATDQILARANRTAADSLKLLAPSSVVATNDTSSTDTNTTVSIAALSNDRDASGVPLSVDQTDTTSAWGATVSINPDGTLRYDPTAAGLLLSLPPGIAVNDTFNYSIRDASGRIDRGTVAVTVTGMAIPPHNPNDAESARASGSNAVVADEFRSGVRRTGAFQDDLRLALTDAAMNTLTAEDDSDERELWSLKTELSPGLLDLLTEEETGRQ